MVELELTLVRRGAALAAPVSTLRQAAAAPQPGRGEPGRPQGEPCRGGEPTPAGGGRLLFTVITGTDDEDLYTIGADGRGLRRVGDDDAHELEPTWSPDGRRIAYTRAEPYDSAPPPSVQVIKADGSGRRALDPDQMSTQPDWSPDGRRIAVSAFGGSGNEDVAVIDPVSGRFRRLTDGPAYEHSPAWSPDGGRISFVRDGNLHIARANGAGGACVRVGMLLTSGARWQPTPR